jgi:hypothetical protein
MLEVCMVRMSGAEIPTKSDLETGSYLFVFAQNVREQEQFGQ